VPVQLNSLVGVDPPLVALGLCGGLFLALQALESADPTVFPPPVVIANQTKAKDEEANAFSVMLTMVVWSPIVSGVVVGLMQFVTIWYIYL
jgi:hypothetical protein